MLFKNLFSKNIKYFSKEENKNYVIDNKIDVENTKLSSNLKDNVNLFKNIFKNDSTFITRELQNTKNKTLNFAIFFFDGMVDSKFLSQNLITPILNDTGFRSNINLVDYVMKNVIACNEVEKSDNLDDIIKKALYGDTILLLDGYKEAIVISSKGWAKRGIEEPGNETVVRGPREGFGESLLQNISLMRRRIVNPNLCVEINKCGMQSNTKYALIYIDGIVNKDVLEEVKKRLNKIDIDAVLDSNYIQELIKDNKHTPFKTTGVTERPDTACGKILEGRICLIVDGTPTALTMPFLFIEYFQSPDDYYLGYYYASFERLIRMLSFVVSISVPALYLSLVTYHQKAIPLSLLLSISTAKQGVPFPTVVELLIFMILFEVLRESSIRMPPGVNQALGVVGGLVIGQAAVEARLLSAPIIIIIALSGITEIMISDLKNAVIIYRFSLLFYSLVLGIYGYMFGIVKMFLHLYDLKSFNIDYMQPTCIDNLQDYKDTFIRAPWHTMIYRPKYLTKHNLKRQKPINND